MHFCRIQEAEKELLDQKQLQSRIRTLEREKSTVQDSLDEETKKYSEALITLKEVQEAVCQQQVNLCRADRGILIVAQRCI